MWNKYLRSTQKFAQKLKSQFQIHKLKLQQQVLFFLKNIVARSQ